MLLKYSLLALSVFALAACSTCPLQTLAIRQWSKQEQKQAAAEIKELPENSILIPMLEDYTKLRREVQ